MVAPRHLRPPVLLVALFAAGCGSDRSQEPLERVLLITCDTLRADRLGAYGYPHPTSPNLDVLARESVVFERAYSTAPMTTPAMSSLFTGRLPDELGVLNNRVQIDPAAISVTEIVQRAGITTGAVLSNWVLARRGLEEAGLQQGFDDYDDDMGEVEANRPHMRERNAKDTTDAAIQWLERREDPSFFLWVHYQDPHGPYTPPDDCLAELQRPLTTEPELRLGVNQRGLGDLPEYQAIGGLRAPEAYRIRYDAEIHFFDRELGRLFDHLRKEGMLEKALVIFTADHGESLGERNYWFSHGQHLHEELVRVPFVVRYPEGYEHPKSANDGAYERVSAMVSHLDVMPTILDAFGLEGPRVYGQSLLSPTITGERIVAHMGAGWQGVSAGRYRIMTSHSGTRLYDVKDDPFESRDLARDDPARIGEMMRRFAALQQSLPQLQLRGVQVARNPVNTRALDALGYTGDEGEPDGGSSGGGSAVDEDNDH